MLEQLPCSCHNSGTFRDTRGEETDLYGFTALPGGYRQYDGGFFLIGDYGYWWASTMSAYQGSPFVFCHPRQS
ncbi:MAG: hypothetical protein KFF49_09310, partial [Bacteroidales bacterium]|nr:hypothetical protein [Bacteroidales bacterium]